MIGAVVLAAGAASRFGSPKQALLLSEVVPRVRESAAVGDLVVVLGAHEVATDARVVRCPDWASGPGVSLRCGLAALPDGCEAAIVVLADGPDLNPAAIDRVVAAWRAAGGDVGGNGGGDGGGRADAGEGAGGDRGSGGAFAASYGGARGHPVLLPRSLWFSIPDAGARAIEPRLVPCDDLGDPGDVDTPEHLPARLRGA